MLTLMDEELVVSALAAGAAARCREDARAAVVIAYVVLRDLVAGRLGEQPDRIDAAASDRRLGHGRLAEALREKNACDREVVSAAWKLLRVLYPRGEGQASGGHSRAASVNGGAIPAQPGVSARPAPSSPDRPVPVASPPARAVPPASAPLRPVSGLRAGASSGGVVGPPGAPRVPGLVILIDGCSGIQVGKDNDQLSVYTVTLPAAFASAEELAELLFAGGTPWARDVFSHDAEPCPPAPQGRPDAYFRRIVAGPSGDALVIVRNSRGVQVGDHSAQRNEFRIVVAPVSVQADSLEMTFARRNAVRRLLTKPTDQAAARYLAEVLAGAAETAVLADVTARLHADLGDPYIHGWPREVSGVTGRQVGEHGTARVKLQVTATKFDAQALADKIAAVATWTAALNSLRAPAGPADGPAAVSPPTDPPSPTSPFSPF
jgi:hypothetical protein